MFTIVKKSALFFTMVKQLWDSEELGILGFGYMNK